MPGLGERIEAWLQVRDAQRFQRDMNQSARSVRNLRKETDGLATRQVALGQGLAAVKISLASYLTLSIGAVPIVLGLAGTVGALTSSFALATLGAAALGTAVGTVLVSNLIGAGLVIGRSIRDFHKVSDALNAYQLAVASYGKGSTQADTALRRLSGTVNKFGGVEMLRAVRNWQELGNTFDSLTTPGRQSVAALFNDAISGAQKVLPAFSSMSNQALSAIRRDAKGLFATLSGPESQSGLRAFGETFDHISGPLARSVSNFFLFLLRTTRVLLPDVEKLAGGVERFSQRAADFAERDDFGNKLHGLLSQTRSWWNLFMEIGGLIIAVVRPGAIEGQKLVDVLTGGVHQLRMMAESLSGQQDIQSFFHDSIDNTVAFAKALWVLLGPILIMARDAMPLWTDVLNANAIGIHAVLSVVLALSNLLEPFGGLLGLLIAGFWAWKVASIALSIAQGILWLTTLDLNAAMIALGVAMAANPIGLIIIGVALLAAGFVLMYNKVGWFHSAVDSAFGFIRDHWPLLLAILTGPIGLAVYAIIKNFDTIKSAGRSAINFVIGLFNAGFGLINSLTPGPLKIKGHTIIPGIPDIPDIPLLATGGNVAGFGSWVSGDAGPELNTWDGTGVHVAPIRSARIAGRGTVKTIDAAALGSGGTRTIIVPVQLNTREIARAVAEDTDDQLARGPG